MLELAATLGIALVAVTVGVRLVDGGIGFEAALTVDPAATSILLDLADAARRNGLQGKAISYYREALTRDPDNLAALSGEGAALVEKGAVDKARRNLARLQSMCGAKCAVNARPPRAAR